MNCAKTVTRQFIVNTFVRFYAFLEVCVCVYVLLYLMCDVCYYILILRFYTLCIRANFKTATKKNYLDNDNTKKNEYS